MTISKELLDELLERFERPENQLSNARLMNMERMLVGELAGNLGYEEGKEAPLGNRTVGRGT